MDIACSSTVFREDWLNCYLQSLNSNKLSHVKESESDTNFKLGCGTTLEIEINNKSNISLCRGGGRSARLVQPRHLQQPYNAKEMGMMQEFRYFTAWWKSLTFLPNFDENGPKFRFLALLFKNEVLGHNESILIT